jgi:hypothetical protein
MIDKFCVEGTITNPDCTKYKVETFDFLSEEQIFDTILDILKSELPPRLAQIKDCQDKPMIITEDSIDLLPPEKWSKYSIILNPVSSNPTYSENLSYRTVVHGFDLILTVASPIKRCVTWELLRFKNVVEALLVATSLYIDGYNSADVEMESFTYAFPDQDEGKYVRQGIIRFTVTVTQASI